MPTDKIRLLQNLEIPNLGTIAIADVRLGYEVNDGAGEAVIGLRLGDFVRVEVKVYNGDGTTGIKRNDQARGLGDIVKTFPIETDTGFDQVCASAGDRKALLQTLRDIGVIHANLDGTAIVE